MRRAVKRLVTLGIVLLLVLITACAPAPGEITPTPTPAPEPTPTPIPSPTPEPTPTPTPEPAPGVDWGIIEIRVTDPPPPGVTSAYVTLTKMEVHQVSDNASQWITIIDEEVTFNLFEIIEEADILGSENVTVGKYTQIRMDVVKVEGLTTDDVPYTAEVPGDKLKIVRPFNVEPETETILTLDFDGDKSLVMTGQGKFLFKPVVKLSIEHERIRAEEEERERVEAEEREREAEEFEGTIETIDGTTWTMTIDGETRTVDVSGAEIEGEPAEGLEAEVEGTVVDNIIVASEVEIKEAEEEEAGELEFEGTIETIDGTTWTMTIDGETRTVDVSGAEIEGEPAEGLEAEIEGTVVDDIIVASEVEIKEAKGGGQG